MAILGSLSELARAVLPSFRPSEDRRPLPQEARPTGTAAAAEVPASPSLPPDQVTISDQAARLSRSVEAEKSRPSQPTGRSGPEADRTPRKLDRIA